ncbi:314_t:CDS:2, partial [Funneliformis geosporum]
PKSNSLLLKIGQCPIPTLHFGIKTDRRAYCRYKILKNGIEEECNYSCMYNTQTSTQQHHLNSIHKEFEKEKL